MSLGSPIRPFETRGSSIFADDGTELFFDCTLSEDTADTVRITSHPVEQGAEITDHVQQQPVTLTLEGMKTATPIFDAPEADRDIAFWEELRRLQGQRQPLTVSTPRRVYFDMLIESIRVPQTPEAGQAIRLTVDFKQLRIAQQQLTEVPPLRRSSRNRLSSGPNGDKGRQNTRDTEGASAQGDAEAQAAGKRAGETRTSTLYDLTR